jgi:uncharacterized protein (DUF1501 family)
MMNLLTRRSFLDETLRLALGAAAAATLHVPLCLRRALAAEALPASTKKVLFVFLRGGNDGLNTLIPWGDDAYSAANRPTLYIPKPDPLTSVPGRMPDAPDLTRALDLGNGFAALHPGLKDLGPLYNAGQLALLHRVGYAKQSRSHFDSQRYWENGMPRNNLAGSGVFYRALVDTGIYQGRKFPAVSVQSTSPLLLRGPVALPNLSDPARYDVLGVANNGADKTKLLSALTAGCSVLHPQKDNRDLLFETGRGLEASIEELRRVGVANNEFYDRDGTTHLFPINAASNQKAFRSEAYGFFNNLKTAAQILAATDAVVAGTQMDGFDTHNNQGALTGPHHYRMQYLGWAFYAVRQFFTSIDPKLWDDTVVVTLSEFGRTSKENGSQGTDHAEASVMLVAGGKVKGGVYECGPDSWTVGPSGAMFQVNARYLRRTVDYRSVLGEIIRDHLGATPTQLERILPGYADPREHLQTGGVAPDGMAIKGELNLVGA